MTGAKSETEITIMLIDATVGMFAEDLGPLERMALESRIGKVKRELMESEDPEMKIRLHEHILYCRKIIEQYKG